jgi:hypothetical protein
MTSYFEHPAQVLWLLTFYRFKQLSTYEVSSKRSTERRIPDALIVVVLFWHLSKIYNKINFTPANQVTPAEILHNPDETVYAYSHYYGPLHALRNGGGARRCLVLVTILHTAKKSGRAFVSAMVDTSERRSWKVRLLTQLFSSAVRTPIWTLDEDTRGIQGGGVISAVLSATWSTTLIGTYACSAIVALVLCGRRFVHWVRRK